MCLLATDRSVCLQETDLSVGKRQISLLAITVRNQSQGKVWLNPPAGNYGANLIPGVNLAQHPPPGIREQNQFGGGGLLATIG